MKAEIAAAKDATSARFVDAARSGDFSLVRRLASKVPEINALVEQRDLRFTTALIEACRRGHKEIVAELLKLGADPEVQDRHQYYAEPQRRRAIHHAAEKGRIEVCRLLIANHAKLDPKDSGKQTPLMLSVWGGHLGVIELLLDSGVDISKSAGVLNAAISNQSRYHNGKLVVSKERCEQIIDLLLERGCNPGTPDDVGTTPLMSSIRRSDVDFIKKLHKFGASLDAQDKRGWTVLMKATNLRQHKIIGYLISAGARMDLKNRDGHTALDIALRKKDHETAKILGRS